MHTVRLCEPLLGICSFKKLCGEAIKDAQAWLILYRHWQMLF
jgi:hypothetical protein